MVVGGWVRGFGAVALVSAVSVGQSFNLDVGGEYSLGSTLGFGAATGQVGAWNDVTQASSGQVLQDVNGAPTSATITWPGVGLDTGWFDVLGQHGKLLNDHQVVFPGQVASWSVQGLANGEYRVTFYSRPTENQGSPGRSRFTLIGGAAGAQDCDGSFVGFFQGYRYGVHMVQDTVAVANGTLAWTFELGSGGEAYFNGMQIERIVPGTITTYCTAKTNSLGCVPAIATSGAPSVSGGQFTVSASNVRSDRAGFLVWSARQNGMPFQGGHLCVARPFVRTAAQSSGGTPGGGDCSGTYAFQFTTPYLGLHGLSAGDGVACQFYSLDPGSPGGVGSTKGVIFTLAP
jgi:hypothetical protein